MAEAYTITVKANGYYPESYVKDYRFECVHWHITDQVWSTVGCELLNTTYGSESKALEKFECSCIHF